MNCKRIKTSNIPFLISKIFLKERENERIIKYWDSNDNIFQK